LRLIEDFERERFDEELVTKHYLKSANAVERVLRYVAEYRGQWVALLMFNSAAYHLKPRDQWLHWVGPQWTLSVALSTGFDRALNRLGSS